MPIFQRWLMLDYAALSSAGMNFYDRRCQLEDQLEYQTLKARAEAGAKRLLSLNLKKAIAWR